MRRFLKWLGGLLALGAVAGAGLYAWFVLWPVNSIPALERVDEYVWLDQGWGQGQNTPMREHYYYTAQGTSMPQGASLGAVRYSWFVNLELPLSHDRFAAPDHMRRWRFLVDPAPTPANPDQLPIGFTRHFDPRHRRGRARHHLRGLPHGRDSLHPSWQDPRVRIDGGPAMHAFTDMQRGNFAPMLAASLLGTALNPAKFDRFAKKVLGSGYPDAKPKLRKALFATLKAMGASGQNRRSEGALPRARGFWPHRCAGPHRQHRVRRSPLRSLTTRSATRR